MCQTGYLGSPQPFPRLTIPIWRILSQIFKWTYIKSNSNGHAKKMSFGPRPPMDSGFQRAFESKALYIACCSALQCLKCVWFKPTSTGCAFPPRQQMRVPLSPPDKHPPLSKSVTTRKSRRQNYALWHHGRFSSVSQNQLTPISTFGYLGPYDIILYGHWSLHSGQNWNIWTKR